MDLYGTTKNLDKFIYDYLQPTSKFLDSVKWSVDKICSFLKEQCFKDYPPPRPRVLKVVKGGSSGKGTALKKTSDADLVVFLTNFKCYSDQKNYRKEIIQEIEKKLSEYFDFSESMGGIMVKIQKTTWDNPRVLSFSFFSRYSEDYIEFDVLPAYDALGQWRGISKPNPEVYIQLIESSEGGGEFSPCFTELQKEFVITRPTKLKQLILLVKYWYKQHIQPYKSRLLKSESLPPKYALELLAIYAWEQGSQKTDFDMAEGFRTVLWLIQQHQELRIFWTKYYDFQNETLGRYLRKQLQKPRPIILDPADPTGNVGGGSRWDLVAKEALLCSQQRFFTTPGGFQVHPWDVPASHDVDISSSYVLSSGYVPSSPYVPSSRYVPPQQKPQEEETSYCNIL